MTAAAAEVRSGLDEPFPNLSPKTEPQAIRTLSPTPALALALTLALALSLDPNPSQVHEGIDDLEIANAKLMLGGGLRFGGRPSARREITLDRRSRFAF